MRFESIWKRLSSSAEKINRIPELIFTVGIPGSGKSRWIRSMVGYEVISPDSIRTEMGDVSDQAQNVSVWNEAKRRTAEHLTRGKNVILDATNLQSQYRKWFLEGLPPHVLTAKIIDVDPDVAKARIKKDIAEGKKRSNVPTHVVDRMFQDFRKTIDEKQLQSEGFNVIDS